MKYRLLFIGLILIINSINAEDSNKANKKIITHPSAQVHLYPDIQNTSQCKSSLELTPKSISIYRKQGCLFANEFYSEGSILNFDGTKSSCVANNGYFKWQVIRR